MHTGKWVMAKKKSKKGLKQALQFTRNREMIVRLNFQKSHACQELRFVRFGA
jgi:hypothetical protein